MLFVVCCLLFVVCCLLFVVCCLLFVIVIAVCYLLYVVCCITLILVTTWWAARFSIEACGHFGRMSAVPPTVFPFFKRRHFTVQVVCCVSV